VSRTPSLVARLRSRRIAADEAGFTIIEVIAALTLFALVSAAAVSMFITGMKASLVVKLDTGAKAVTQERIEKMRNLTYHIAHQASGFNPPDVLDLYYRTSLTNAGPIAGDVVPAGYVSTTSTGSTYRLAEEPATGAFYRFVEDPVAGFPSYRQYVATQFIDTNGDAVTPSTGYNSQAVSPADDPPTSMLGITVVTRWTAGTLTKDYSVYTRLSDAQPAPPQITIQGRIAALHVQTSTNPTTQLLVEAGVLGLDGSLTTAGRATASGVAASATLSTGLSVEGAVASVNVPPAATAVNASASDQELDDGVDDIVEFTDSSLSNVGASLTSLMPQAASAASPVTSILKGTGGDVFDVTNHPTPEARLQINTGDPLVWISGGAGDAAKSTGYMVSTSGAAHAATTALTAQTKYVKILPTSFAPDGIVRVKLTGATIECTSNGAAPAVTGGYDAEVQYLVYTPSTGTYSYQTLAVDENTSVLTPALLSTVQVGFDPTSGAPLMLGDYILSWSNATDLAGSAEIISNGAGISINTPGLVSLETVATRFAGVPDDTSTIGVQFGGFSCVAEDRR